MRKTNNTKTKYISRVPISDKTILLLNLRAAGRCQFRGCNKDLQKDILTGRRANLGHIAHIIAAKEDGARGNDPMPLEERNQVSNLMLLCMVHHKIVDDKAHEEAFPKELLYEFKSEHEKRIMALTAIGIDRQTAVVRMFGRIRGNVVTITENEVSRAVFESEGRYPFYLQGQEQLEIDMSRLAESPEDAYWKSGKEHIKDILKSQILPGIEKGRIKHLSVFALTRISFLAYLGYELGDKVPIDFYQKHRDGSEGWCWQNRTVPVEFSVNQIQKHHTVGKVALMLSLSGKISKEDLPVNITDIFEIYEIAPLHAQPERTLIKSKADLLNFKSIYQRVLREIEQTHGAGSELHVFAAVPAPVAVISGRELLRGVSPAIILYEKNNETYYATLKINSNDTE